MIRRPTRSPLFPYTALVLSQAAGPLPEVVAAAVAHGARTGLLRDRDLPDDDRATLAADLRSEEHTSELQSRQYIVCRVLLEEKINPAYQMTNPQLSIYDV